MGECMIFLHTLYFLPDILNIQENTIIFNVFKRTFGTIVLLIFLCNKNHQTNLTMNLIRLLGASSGWR